MNMQENSSNRLIGWLVSYSMKNEGKSFELRAGRCLITHKETGASKKSGPTISIAADDVSTPHAALNASPRHRLMIQDIFSDSGTFVQRISGNQEIKVSSPLELNHGDWIRIGDSERFQVCLIDAGALRN